MKYPIPVIGFSAFSGTGKTTLLTHVLPLLRTQGLRFGVIKHAHHDFDIDYPGKDSYKLRHAGADIMLITSRQRMALVHEYRDQGKAEPTLEQALAAMNPESLDLVLVEGFKAAHFPKIELHRPELGSPLMFPDDPDIIAIASTIPASELVIDPGKSSVTCLDLNQPGDIADFISRFVTDFSQPLQSEQHV